MCIRDSITPDEQGIPVDVPVGFGQLTTGAIQGQDSRLYATAMCLQGDDNVPAVTLCACDVLNVPPELLKAKEEAEGTQLIISATHTHSGPVLDVLLGSSVGEAAACYVDQLRGKVLQAAHQAAHNTQEATLQVESGSLEGWSFNRRYIMRDHTVHTHPMKGDPEMERAEGPDPHRLIIWAARDTQGRVLGAALGFGCHATCMSRTCCLVSADYPGKACAALSSRLGGVPVLFWSTAAGNACQVNPADQDRCELGAEHASMMGDALAEHAMHLLQRSPGAAPAPSLCTAMHTVHIPYRVGDAALLCWAQSTAEEWQGREGSTVPSLSEYGTEGHSSACVPPVLSLDGLFATEWWTRFYANEVLMIHAEAEQHSQGLAFEVTAVRVSGCCALVALPCELFVEIESRIVQASPFEHTTVITLANGYHGYVPSEEAFTRQGGYETKLVSSSKMAEGAGGKVLQACSQLLQHLYHN
eukprot:TRINITY_DN14931_c0_g1_i2.p2 TRINITY_DN14931_c0_g1~~TRINITY_DN14931_c0_g1_i2.p2  ORF type:complete len:472 (-),score=145.19 TRINITY_DN14931_c0_g1_i2:274-1689(-)